MNDTQPPGLRIFTCAHSFHNFVPEILAQIAAAAGIRDHRQVGCLMIGGSRVSQHWDVPEMESWAKEALGRGGVDVLTLSPIWLPDEGIENFARLGLEHNPAIRICVQEFWLPNDEYVPVYPLAAYKEVDHDATDLDVLREHQGRYLRDLDEYVRGINQRLGRDAVCVVPAGQAALRLRERIVRGTAPGLRAQWQLFSDCWGHPAAPLRMLTAYCHFAVIYGRSPAGLPAIRLPGAPACPEWDGPLSRLLQELAWTAAVVHPMSGT